jgi:hypothetical protein
MRFLGSFIHAEKNFAVTGVIQYTVRNIYSTVNGFVDGLRSAQAVDRSGWKRVRPAPTGTKKSMRPARLSVNFVSGLEKIATIWPDQFT